MITTDVSRLIRLISRSLALTTKSATAPSSIRDPSGSISGTRARSSTDVRSDSRKASRIVSSRSVVRSSGNRSPRIAPATVNATSSVVRPSLRGAVTVDDDLDFLFAHPRLGPQGLETLDRREPVRDLTRDPASCSVDSPESCRLNDVGLESMSKTKLGLPMMISGISFMTRFMTSAAGSSLRPSATGRGACGPRR